MDTLPLIHFLKASSTINPTADDGDVDENQKITPKPPVKEVDASDREAILAERLKELESRLTIHRVKGGGSLGVAEWIPEKRWARRIKKKRGYKLLPSNDKFLTPLETVGGIEFGEFQVLLNGLPLSLEEAYHHCFSSSRDLDVYHIYRELRRNGFAPSGRLVVMKIQHTNLRQPIMDDSSPRNSADEPLAKKSRFDMESSSSLNIHTPLTTLTLDMVRNRGDVVPPLVDYLKEKAKSWTEFKLMLCHSDPTFSGYVVDLRSKTATSQFPSAALSRHKTRVIYPPDSPAMSIKEVCKKLQDQGPRVFNLSSEKPTTEYHCLNFSGQGIRGAIYIISENDPLPSVEDINNITTISGLQILVIISESSLRFLRLNSFLIWEEIPELWLNNEDTVDSEEDDDF